MWLYMVDGMIYTLPISDVVLYGRWYVIYTAYKLWLCRWIWYAV